MLHRPFLSGPDKRFLPMSQALKLPAIATLFAFGANKENETPSFVITGPGCFGPQATSSEQNNISGIMVRRGFMIILKLILF